MIDVQITWLDGTVRTYPKVQFTRLNEQGTVLIIYGPRITGGKFEIIASVPLFSVREYTTTE